MRTTDYLFDKYGPAMTPNDAGEVIHRHPTRVRELIQQGALPGVKIGNRWVIPTAKFAEILEGGTVL